MRYAIISDVHANEAALRAVLQDAADAKAERIVCLGDVLGYGPDPVETLELVYRRAHVCLAGNHDDAISGRCGAEDFTEFAAAAVVRQRAALSREAVDWLRHLPYTCEFSGDGGDAGGAFACTHGEFSDPKAFDYVVEPADAEPSFRARVEPLLFVGHTHRPCVIESGPENGSVLREPDDFTLEPGRRYLVNVGSVGYPRNGVCRSFYCIYDDVARAVTFRSLPFDLEGYRAKMKGRGLDEAPWMRARSAERGGREVRGAARFGRPAKKSRPRPRLLPAEAHRTAVGGNPEARRSPARRSLPSRHLASACVLGALIVSLAGVWCTRALLRGKPSVRVEEVPVATPLLPAPPVQDADRFPGTRQLAGGWQGLLEFPAEQDVKIASVARKGVVPAFRIESARRGTVRLVKTISLMERPPKVYWSVNLLSTALPGKPLDFAFNAHLRFLDARGALRAERFGSGKRSAANRAEAVPAGAERAELTIDCVCEGGFDLAVPHFRTEPERRADAGGKKKRKDIP